jgi:hypothetical protein
MLIPRRTKASLVTGLSAVLGICTFSAVTGSDTASASPATYKQARVTGADTYVDSLYRHKARNTSTKLVASHSGHRSKTALVKFRVPAVPAGYVRTATNLHLTVKKTTGSRLVVRSLTRGWNARTVSYRHSVVAGKRVASPRVAAHQRYVDVNVNRGLTPGRVTFSLSAKRGTTVLKSLETGARSAPRLVFTYTLKAASSTPTSTPSSTATPAPTGAVKIGMSAPSAQWSQRVSEVGTGLTARRIFADLAQGGDDQKSIIDATFKAGMMPVISYKLGGDAAGAKAGKYDAAAKQAAALIASYNKPATVSIWHEPQGDLSAADFVAINQRLVPIFKTGQIKVGPFLNGWLLDRQADTTFASFAPASLMKMWDFLGIDTYESGTLTAPGATKPADRIPLLVNFEKKRGYTLPLTVGEYNGYSAKTITDAGNAILNTPQVWFGCMWNSTIGKGYTLTGDRLAAFKATVAKAGKL